MTTGVHSFLLLYFPFLTSVALISVVHRQFDREGPVVITDESRLHEDLFHKKRRSHPTNQPLDVYFKVVLKSIVDYDAIGEAIVIFAFIDQRWKNPGLSWDPNLYGGIKKINVRPEETWLPDIYAYYDVEAQFRYNGLLDTLKTNIILEHDGSHDWLAPVVFNLGCGMNVKDFPFDTQKCALLFGSFTHDKTRLNLIPEDVDTKDYSESSEWIFKSMNHTRHETIYPGSTVEFSDIKYTVILKRKSLYYFIKVLYPTIVLTFLTLLVFIQPITGGERTVYLITVLLALCWYVTLAVNYLPSSSEGIPLSQLFLALALFIMMLLSICLCYSIGIHYGDLSGVDMPTYLRKYVLNQLGPYMGFRLTREYPSWRKDLRKINEAEKRLHDGVTRDNTNDKNVISSQNVFDDTMESIAESLEETLGTSGIEQLESRLNLLLKKLEEEDDNAWTRREWRTVALVLDRLFLYSFSTILILTVIYCIGYVLCIHL